MGSSSLSSSSAFVLFSFFLFSPPLAFLSAEEDYSHCAPFSCGRFTNISYPFSNKEDCGLSIIDCVDDSRPMIKWEQKEHEENEMLGWKEYEVTAISGDDKTITILDHNFTKLLQTNKCRDLYNFTKPYSPVLSFEVKSPNLTFSICKADPHSSTPEYLNGVHGSLDCGDHDLFFYDINIMDGSQFGPDCREVQFPVPQLPSPSNGTWKPGEILSLLNVGFDLQWSLPRECQPCESNGTFCIRDAAQDFRCVVFKKGREFNPRKLIAGVSAGGTFIISATIIVCWLKFRSSSGNSVAFWKKETRSAQYVEEFLRDYGPLVPRRYKYSDVKKMTDSFKNKVGQGGYGGVFKGKLLDGRLVAVKVLSEYKGNGEEFINEIASISRTSHVNIVTLLGFCVEGPKRALIYKFMLNGSLEKLIYDEKKVKTHPGLGWERLYQIAVGIARGLEYLHRGCNTRILHFDIKPHNILLDEDFCPKIADFGLAKLCPRKESIISMAGARGTPGYIAPEVFSRNFGGVSHKSDVYSYGMMVLEMVGGRKNIDVGVDNTSEIYFPHWIYNHLHQHRNLGLDRISTDVDEEIAQKMILVGLWCIQSNPCDRPSMSKALDMLEGNLESLSFPPKPFISSPTRSPAGSSTT